MSPRKLLIADDDPALRELVAVTLESSAYQILVAADGVQALDIARRERPQVAVLDYQMPGLDGLEVCRRLRQDNDLAAMVVVLLTASSEHRDEALAAGANTYLTKPFSPLQLLAVVEEALELPRGDQVPAAWTPPKPAALPALAAFMFADIRNFSAFTVRNGDAAAHQLVRQFQRLVSDQTGLHGGRRVKEAGDNVLLVFPAVRQALQTAAGLMKAVTDYNTGSPDHPLSVGIGLDVGEPVAAGDDYIGKTLNRAARITALAGSGRILATETVIHLAADVPGVSYRDLGRQTLRGFEEGEALYEVIWPGAPPGEGAIRVPAGSASGRGRLRPILLGAVAAALVAVVAVILLASGPLRAAVPAPEHAAPLAVPP